MASMLVTMAGTCTANEKRTDFEQSLIGKEGAYSLTLKGSIDSPMGECKELGSYSVQGQKGLVIGSFDCGGRELMVFVKVVVPDKYDSKIRILDAFLLPRLKHGERLMMAGDCELNGKTDKDFVAHVALGRREKVTWKNGVHVAWAPNPETEKIESISTRDIVCWRPTPP